MANVDFDLAIVGADSAGLAAAATAAGLGRSVVVFKTGFELPDLCAAPYVPDAAWQRLALYSRFNQPVRSRPRRTIFTRSKSDPLEVFGSTSVGIQYAGALGDDGLRASEVWPEFVRTAAQIPMSVASVSNLFADLTTRLGPAPTDTADAFLDQFFASEDLKAHLSVSCLSQFGLAGDEPGSISGLGTFSEEGFPASLREGEITSTLREICAERNVVVSERRLQGVKLQRNGVFVLDIHEGSESKARNVMASDARLAQLFGIRPTPQISPLTESRYACCYVTATFADSPQTEHFRDDAQYIVVKSRDQIRRARDDAAVGRAPVDGPLVVVTHERKIVIAAPFCPITLIDNGIGREWASQDRQAFGRAILDRLKSEFRLSALPLKIDVQLNSQSKVQQSKGLTIDCPKPAANNVGAAIELADRMVAHA
ncbi:MAG: hypothetical protein AAF668_01570 [Pseudomonadota bacterium]